MMPQGRGIRGIFPEIGASGLWCGIRNQARRVSPASSEHARKKPRIPKPVREKIPLIAAGMVGLAVPGTAELVAHYKFDEDENAGVAVDGLGEAHGTVGADVITGEPGIAGNAYRFSHPGSGTVDDSWAVIMGNAPFLSSLTTQYTFSAWIKSTDTTGNRNTVVFAGANANNVYSDLGLANDLVEGVPRGEASARNRPVGATGPQQTGFFSDGVKVNDGEWHHLVMTVNLPISVATLYVDGVPAGTQTASAIPAFGQFEIGRLGRLTQTKVDPFDGLIDDVQVYRRALTTGEVQYLHANPGTPVAPPAVPLAITSSFIEDNIFRIHFTGTPFTTYRVRGSADLQSFDIDLGNSFTNEQGEGTAGVSLIPDVPREFYRIEGIPAP